MFLAVTEKSTVKAPALIGYCLPRKNPKETEELYIVTASSSSSWSSAGSLSASGSSLSSMKTLAVEHYDSQTDYPTVTLRLPLCSLPSLLLETKILQNLDPYREIGLPQCLLHDYGFAAHNQRPSGSPGHSKPIPTSPYMLVPWS